MEYVFVGEQLAFRDTIAPGKLFQAPRSDDRFRRRSFWIRIFDSVRIEDLNRFWVVVRRSRDSRFPERPGLRRAILRGSFDADVAE
jgi:hypothetical protein